MDTTSKIDKMPAVSGPVRAKRKRKSTQRSRVGCRTCRQRHMKCDETIPSCLNCVAAGWNCDGCGSPTRDALESLHIASYAIPFRVPGSRRDRQALHYYCVQGSRDIAGYLESDFWTDEVLRASHHEPLVRQALVSLSLLHLGSVPHYGTKTVENEALMRYGKALRALNHVLQTPNRNSVRSALICCVLFYSFETAQGQPENAMQHLESGLKIISQPHSVFSDEIDQDAASLHKIFRRLDLQATIFDQEREPMLAPMLSGDLEPLGSLSPDTSVQCAFDELVMIQSSIFHFLVKNTSTKAFSVEAIPDDVLSRKHNLMHRLDKWKKTFDHLNITSRHNGQCTDSLKVLTVQWHICRMLLASGHPLDSTVWGNSPNVEAARVLDLVGDVIAIQNPTSTNNNPKCTFRRTCSAETGIVASLFILCMKCSDPLVRRRAAKLLEVVDRREGLYDSRNMSAVVRKFETARCHDRVLETSLDNCFRIELHAASGTMDHLADCFKA